MRKHSRCVPVQSCSLSLEQLEQRIALYAQPVHQYLAAESYFVFADQFGESLMTPHLGSFVSGANNEDSPGANPFNQGEVGDPCARDSIFDHPSIRHFWGHDPTTYSRVFNQGVSDGIDSAPNRAIKYMTGGIGYDSVADPAWAVGLGNGAATLSQVDPAMAFDYLGHIAHLFQDMSVPAHAHGDKHIETPCIEIPLDPDPYHDYVDGVEFSTSLSLRRPASFDDVNPTRWTTFGSRSTIANTDLRTASELDSNFSAGTASPDVDPLYKLFEQVASRADDFDSRNAEGQVDRGSRGDLGVFGGASNYDNWTQAELELIGLDMVPLALHGGAELIRYYFGVIDGPSVEEPSAGKPFVQMPQFCSTNSAEPQAVSDPRIALVAAATDQDTGDSGIGRSLFKFEFKRRLNDGSYSAWTEIESGGFGTHFRDGGPKFGQEFAGKHGASSVAVFEGEMDGVYAFRAFAEDGAGNINVSDEYYVRVGEPALSVVTVLDVSGSMEGQRLQTAKQSAAEFIAIRNEFDRVGVVQFSGSASVPFALTEISPLSDIREKAQAAIREFSAGGSTSIGAGLLAAFGQFGENPVTCTNERAILVLTDGEENTPPFIRDVLDRADPSIKIYGIALGGGANASQLQQVTNERRGEFFQIRDGESAGAAFARLSGLVSDEQDILSENGEIAQGETIERSFRVDASAGELTVGVQWPGSELDLRLVMPNGTVIDRNAVLAGVRVIASTTSEFYKIEQPAPGIWKTFVEGIEVDGAGEPYQLLSRVVSPLKGRVLPGPDEILVGEQLPLRVLLSEGGAALGATVTGTLTPVNGGAPLTVTMLDDGQHHDSEANDGVYGAEVLAGTAGRGAYFFQVEASGVSPSGAPFTRAPSRTFVVTGDGIAVEPYAPFLQALYQGLLKRNADQAGLAYWEQQLQHGVARAVVVDGFYRSVEHRGIQVDEYYRDYLGRAADAVGRADWIHAFQQGADEFTVMNGFLASPEYARRQGSEQDLVEGLYQDVLGRTGDRDGVNFWLQAYRYSDRAKVAAGFVTSIEHRQRLIDEVYATYLGREPARSESDEAIARLKTDRGLGPTLRALLSDDEFVEGAS